MQSKFSQKNVLTSKRVNASFGITTKRKKSNSIARFHHSNYNQPIANDSLESERSTESLVPIANVSIMGRPNVGKSSLFNRLLQKHIAVTSDISGSTRDINKCNLQLDAFTICLIDTGGLDVFTPLFSKSCKSKSTAGLYVSSDYSHRHNNKTTQPRMRVTSIVSNQQQIASALRQNISLHSYHCVRQSDIVIYVVDGSTSADDGDIRIFRELSKQKPTILVLNKVDSDKVALDTHDFMSFGVDFLMISVRNNRGITKLLAHLESIVQKLLDSNQLQKHKIFANGKKVAAADYNIYSRHESYPVNTKDIKCAVAIPQDNFSEFQKQNEVQQIAIGIIGRPNVGKSSLLNALTQSNRSLVSDIAGTTIDPVNETIIYNDVQITFVDTAGIRRRSRIDGIEKFALERTQRILQQCDIVLLVLDSSTEFVELDEKISSLANSNALGIIVVLNKWDMRCKDYRELKQIYLRKFKFLEYAPMLTVSATTYRHIEQIKQKIIEVYHHFSYRIPTAKLNDCIQKAIQKHPIPSDHGKFIKIYYATQFDVKPPRIALIMNKAELHFSYKRYLINVLRSAFGLSGVPIVLELRNKTKDVS
ncbi:ribosome biogenesis GTPase Der [Helicobacter aurati]|uniref:ribosome biogenesis GTPase Der n=1 Tax=Helicobacter aurati TaxID=137778 RepID=UPI00131509C4|nr:ribosome biogenesis GTPase Der [Helicobacter aurati]